MHDISNYITEHQIAITKIDSNQLRVIADACIHAIKSGGTIYTCGNGGSASDASHFVAELVGRFEKERKALNAICLNTDFTTMTSIANDYGYEHIFSRQVESMIHKNDILIGFTTSGSSANVIEALKCANMLSATTICFTGKIDRTMAEVFSTHTFKVPIMRTAIIQECHIMAIHIVSLLIEEAFVNA